MIDVSGWLLLTVQELTNVLSDSRPIFTDPIRRAV